MYKKSIIVVLLLIMVIITFVGCNLNSYKNNSTSDEKHADKYYISFSVDPWPLDQKAEEKQTFFSYCLISDISGEMSDSEFNNALVSVNDLVLNRVANSLFSYAGKELEFKSGDNIKVSVYHPAFDQLEKSITVPPVVNNLRSDDNIDQFLNQKVETYSFEWDSYEVDQYLIICKLYDANHEKMEEDIIFINEDNTSSKFELQYSQGNFDSVDFMKIIVYNVNCSYENGIYGNFRLNSKSPAGRPLSNLPELLDT